MYMYMYKEATRDVVVHLHVFQTYRIFIIWLCIYMHIIHTKMASFWGNEDILQDNEGIFVSHSVIWELFV